ncbi:MAG: APC family permease, partial [Aeromonas sp.]
IITALLVIGALFILQSYIATLIQPDFTKMDENNAFFDAALLAGGPFLKTVLLVVNILAIGIANTMAAQAAASRVLFGMARDKFLPKALSRVHAKYQTPHISTLFMAALSLIVALLTSIDFLTKLINFGALTSFIILNFSVFWLFFVKKQQRNGLHLLNHLVYPWLGMLILAYVWINFDKATLTIGFIWLGCGIVLGFFKTKGYKELPSIQFG